jgi:peptide/nickel transport system substrate-binding protein
MKNLKRLVCVLMIIVLGAALFTGCKKSETKTDSTVPEASREVVVGIPKVTESFNFYNTINGYESYSMTQVYDSLVTKDKTGAIAASLAENYDVSEDGMEYTFHLRKGVKFSDGSELKASDIVYSMNQAIASAYTSWIYEPLVESCTASDEYTVYIKLKKGSIGFLDYLSNINYFAVLSEKACTTAGDSYGTSVETIVGTGPYKVTEWKLGESVVYEANEDYFGGVPAVKSFKLKSISDSNTAVIALQTGEIQAYWDDIPGVSYSDIQKDDSLNLIDYASTIYFEVIMNCETGTFSDVNLRKAVAMAVNRENMLTVGAEGQGIICDYPGARDGSTVGDPKVTGSWYQTDIEAAKKLVEDAGATGKSVVIKTYADDPYPALATILQDALTSIGLSVTVQQMERSALIDEVMTKGDFEIGICRWAAGTTDMDEIWYGSLDTDSKGASGNWSWYSNPDLDSILKAAGGETDAEARKDMYKQAIEIFSQDVPQIPLYYPNGSRAYSKNLKIEDGLVQYNRMYDYSYVE